MNPLGGEFFVPAQTLIGAFLFKVVLSYLSIQRVRTTRRDHTKSTNNMTKTNNIINHGGGAARPSSGVDFDESIPPKRWAAFCKKFPMPLSK
jgi:hypothetical protein